METLAKVMWCVDDEIREMIKFTKLSLAKPLSKDDLRNIVEMMIDRVQEMIFKEEGYARHKGNSRIKR